MPAAAQGATLQVTYDSQQSPAGLWTANADGSGGQASFRPGAYMSSWSQDGSKVAFATSPCRNGGGGTGHIDVMNADGSGLVQLANGCDPRISPDGTKVAFEGADTSETLYVVGTAEGSTPALLNPTGGSDGQNGCSSYATTAQVASCARPDDPAWLGNNTIIWEGALEGLWTMPATAGAHPTEISGTDSSSGFSWYFWGLSGSSDGTKIAAAGYDSHHSVYGIYTLPAGGGTPVPVVTAGTNHQYLFPQFSADGTKITFEDYNTSSHTSNVYAVPTTGGATSLISGADTTAANPSFAPPQKTPAFTASPTSGVSAGSSISFHGQDFSSGGGPVTVAYNDFVDPVKSQTFSPPDFSGTTIAGFGHPITDTGKACTAQLAATQGKTSIPITISGAQQQVIEAARGIARSDGPLKPPDFVCRGEVVGATSGGFDILTIPVVAGYPFPRGGEANLAALNDTDDRADSNFVPVGGYVNGGQPLRGQIFLGRGATLCALLGPSGSYGSITAPDSLKGPYEGLGNIGGDCRTTEPHGNPAHKPSAEVDCSSSGAQSVPSGIINGDEKLSGLACVKGSLEVKGNLVLSNAHLVVEGDLKVDGSVSGTGALFVDGGTTIKGDYSGWSTDASVLIAAGGDVHLQTAKAEIQNALRSQLAPRGNKATVAAVLKHKGYTQKLNSPAVGNLDVAWYLVPAGAHLAKGKRKPILVAKGHVRFTKAGKRKFKIKLTKRGRKLLKHTKKRLKLVVRGRFMLPQQKMIEVKKRFKLRL